jgi:N-acetylglucosaminyldiphosphoundecaprenol N-acetyl-beta-D-mannosaminyltransferase
MKQAVATVLDWCADEQTTRCRNIVTPNVDHIIMLQKQPDLRAAYEAATLVLADGAPLVFASRWLKKDIPERVAGSDIVNELFASAREPLRVFLLGAGPGVADIAAEKIRLKWPTVNVVGTYSPPFGFEKVDAENNRILSAIAEARPHLLIVGFGAPKQELWVHRFQDQLQARVAICAGATIDFIAEHRRRSPVWMSRAGLEWLHRLAIEPRRLFRRYARDAVMFPPLLWREWRNMQLAPEPVVEER